MDVYIIFVSFGLILEGDDLHEWPVDESLAEIPIMDVSDSGSDLGVERDLDTAAPCNELNGCTV